MNCPFCEEEGRLSDSGAKISGFIIDAGQTGQEIELEIKGILSCGRCYCSFLWAGNKLFKINDIRGDEI